MLAQPSPEPDSVGTTPLEPLSPSGPPPCIAARRGRKLGTIRNVKHAAGAIFRALEGGKLAPDVAYPMIASLNTLLRAFEAEREERLAASFEERLAVIEDARGLRVGP